MEHHESESNSQVSNPRPTEAGPLANRRLRLPDGQSLFCLAPPEALDVCENCDYLLVAELVAKRRHSALEARIARVFKYPSTLTDSAVQEAIPMMPGMPVAIERRRQQGAVFLPDLPVGLPLASYSMTHSAIRGKEHLTYWSIPPRGGTAGRRIVWAGEDEHAAINTKTRITMATAPTGRIFLTSVACTYRIVGKVPSIVGAYRFPSSSRAPL